VDTDIELHNDANKKGFLAFLRLVGTVYFKKHATGFDTHSPASHFLKFTNIVLRKGCKCASGCQNRRCGCQRKNSVCTEGCQCTDCQNCPNSDSTPQTEESDDVLTIALEEAVTNNGHLNGEKDEFAEFVFAALFDSECVESNEDSL